MRNPDRNFPDMETGMILKRIKETKNTLLVDQKNKTLVNVIIEGDTRFMELYNAGTEEKNQFRDLYGTWGTQTVIVYFDFVSGDQDIIRQDDYVYFNKSTMFKNVAYNPNLKDTVRVVLKDVPMYTGLTEGLTGVDCGMLECIGYVI